MLVFKYLVYNISVFEDVVFGVCFFIVLVVDDDIGNNVIVNYYIIFGNKGVVFVIIKEFG